MMWCSLWILVTGLTLAVQPPVAQEPMQGETPERVEVSDLLRNPSLYDGKTVVVHGELHGDFDENIYWLRGHEMPFREVRIGESRMRDDLRLLQGQKVIITGIFWDLVTQCYSTPQGPRCFDRRLIEFGALTRDYEREENRYFIGVMVVDLEEDEPLPKEEEPKEEEEPADLDIEPGELVDLRDLVKNPTPLVGRRVSVIGKFRGNNLYSDLSIRTKKTPRDFIIKVSDIAIWVTGRRPRGKGFELNPRMRRDTGKWLKVTGRPWIEEDMVYLRAETMEIVPEPDDPSLEPVDVAEEEEKELGPPPEVTFSIPLDGERGIALDTEFQVQFSKDMEAASFNRNVDLLYADDDGMGDPFPDMQIRYQSADRTLLVIPGKELDPEKEIQLILYEGIMDEDGQPLVAVTTDIDIPDVAVMLTFFTAPR